MVAQGPFAVVIPFVVNGTMWYNHWPIILRAELEPQLSDICERFNNEVLSRNLIPRNANIYPTTQKKTLTCATTVKPEIRLEENARVKFSADLVLSYFIDDGDVALDNIEILKFNHWIHV